MLAYGLIFIIGYSYFNKLDQFSNLQVFTAILIGIGLALLYLFLNVKLTLYADNTGLYQKLTLNDLIIKDRFYLGRNKTDHFVITQHPHEKHYELWAHMKNGNTHLLQTEYLLNDFRKRTKWVAENFPNRQIKIRGLEPGN